MNRLERAIWIRDHILQHPDADWTPSAMVGQGRTLRRASYVAYHWAHDARGNRADIRQLPGVAVDQTSPFLNVLDIYVSSFANKAFSLDWFQDQHPHLRSMKRGAWESDLFALPPYRAQRQEIRHFYTPTIISDALGL